MEEKYELKTDFEINKIKNVVEQIKSRINSLKLNGKTDPFEFEMDIMENMPEFYSEYPFLVKKLVSGQDITYLYKMLETLNQVQNGNKSFAGAELTLGKELADKYLPKNI